GGRGLRRHGPGADARGEPPLQRLRGDHRLCRSSGGRRSAGLRPPGMAAAAPGDGPSAPEPSGAARPLPVLLDDDRHLGHRHPSLRRRAGVGARAWPGGTRRRAAAGRHGYFPRRRPRLRYHGVPGVPGVHRHPLRPRGGRLPAPAPRARPAAYEISSLLHYAVLFLGFLLAVGALGVDLNKFTVLAGAFGVGLGFGLQGVVNNCVSGLIVLVERPIHVGDAIQMSDLAGEVRRIGIRATTVRTWEGAEVIVPNASLVSEKLTNWTYSDRLRRMDLPVGVAYGSAPEKVLELLLAVAHAHPGVLAQPVPEALFMGFGESALYFELRAWTGRFNQWA